MKVAIIGGGASGLISAYLLDKKYDVHVFEKDAILGGNVRTLNRNVECSELDNRIKIENGVLGFNQYYYPNFHRLMDHLKVGLITGHPSVALYHANQFYPSNPNSLLNASVLRKLFTNRNYIQKLINLNRNKKHFLNTTIQNYREGALADILPSNTLLEKYIRSLMMLSFSTPFENTEILPTQLCIPFIKALKHTAWSFVKGGVYKYLEVILQNISCTVYKGDPVVQVTRGNKIQLSLKSGNHLLFDKVIFATTPGQVSKLLTDADTQEKDCFDCWKDRPFQTIAHTDTRFYRPYQKTSKTPMDFFHHFQRDEKGYNTYMNNGYEIKGDIPYSFAYELEKHINPEKILDRQMHTVPVYNSQSWKTRELIQRINGHRNTYYVGAYLGNGLHEGAVTSAMEVSELMGGKAL